MGTTCSEDLPTEIWFLILKQLDYEALLRVGATCRKWYVLSEDSRLWKNICRSEAPDEIMTNLLIEELRYILLRITSHTSRTQSEINKSFD